MKKDLAKKLTFGILILAIFLTFLMGYLGQILLFILLFSLVVWFLFLFLLWKGIDILWRLIHTGIHQEYKENTHKFRLLTVLWFILIAFCFYTVNHYLLPGGLHPLSLISNLIVLLFSIILGWSILKKLNRKIVLFGFSVFVLYTSFLWVNKSIATKHSQMESIGKLQTLPYLKWVPTEQSGKNSGVTKYNPLKSFKGINIYVSRNLPKAFLMDIFGNVLHTWSFAMNEDDEWQHAEMGKNGDIVTYVQDSYVMRLDWQSHVIWKKRLRAHHDIALEEDGDIWLITRKDKIVRISVFPLPILCDYLVEFSHDGNVKQEICFYEIFKDHIPITSIIKLYVRIPLNFIGVLKHMITDGFLFDRGTSYDVFHNNTVELINRDIEDLCQKGDFLVSPRTLDTIGIIDRKTEKLIWSWGYGHLSQQHQPTLLENNNILIFDNGVKKNYSRIVELDPINKKVVWEYLGSPPETFFSHTRGGSQRLPNGNTLITESNKGRVFEVTKEGEIVWEFYNPEIKEDKKWRGAIYRLMRITDPVNYPVLKGLQ